jgi:hypothetical protein
MERRGGQGERGRGMGKREAVSRKGKGNWKGKRREGEG